MKEYIVVIDGQEHAFLYDDEDAKRLGLKAAEKPANKSRTVANKSKG